MLALRRGRDELPVALRAAQGIGARCELLSVRSAKSAREDVPARAASCAPGDASNASTLALRTDTLSSQCAITHGALTPVDVVKTRIQLEPEVYNKVRRARALAPTGRG
jgi:hypothetical protein